MNSIFKMDNYQDKVLLDKFINVIVNMIINYMQLKYNDLNINFNYKIYI